MLATRVAEKSGNAVGEDLHGFHGRTGQLFKQTKPLIQKDPEVAVIVKS
jgi:hypothetical protein